MTTQDFEELERFLKINRGNVKDYKEVCRMAIAEAKPYIFVQGQEKKNLFLHKLKKEVALNPVFQNYFEQTEDKNKKKKMARRLLGLPGLCLKLLNSRKKTKEDR